MVRNDHVLAIVKLKEEELEREEQAQKRQRTSDDEHEHDADGDDGNDTPKLTRSKAKELQQFPLPLVPMKHSRPNEDVVALIHDDLHSDDDDEEYQPCDEDLEVRCDRILEILRNFDSVCFF